MGIIVCVLLVMLLWNLIKMVKSITKANERIARNDKHHRVKRGRFYKKSKK